MVAKRRHTKKETLFGAQKKGTVFGEGAPIGASHTLPRVANLSSCPDPGRFSASRDAQNARGRNEIDTPFHALGGEPSAREEASPRQARRDGLVDLSSPAEVPRGAVGVPRIAVRSGSW